MLTKRRELINVHADVCWWCLLNSSVERLVARVTLRGLDDRIRQRWYQNWTPVMSQLPAVLAVPNFCGWTFKQRPQWSDDECVCSRFGWPAMSAYIITVWTTAPSCFPPKEKKSKRNVWVMRRHDKRIYGCLCSGGRMNSSVGVLFVFRRQ